MSNDAREGWCKPERPKPWTADGYIVRDANGAGFAECPTRADAQTIASLSALDAPVADEGAVAERVAEFRELDAAWREWEALIHRDMTKPETRLHNAIAIVLAAPALHATPATTQGSEAELRELQEQLGTLLSEGFEGERKRCRWCGASVAPYHDACAEAHWDLLQTALATPKPVEGETCAVEDCGMGPGYWLHHPDFTGQVGAHPFQPKPVEAPAQGSECPHGCNEHGMYFSGDPRQGWIHCPKHHPAYYGPIHATKPEATTELRRWFGKMDASASRLKDSVPGSDAAEDAQSDVLSAWRGLRGALVSIRLAVGE